MLDVTIFSAFTALSTFASIIQQLHYATAWEVIKQAQFDKALASQKRKGLAFGGAAQIVDQVLFYIRESFLALHRNQTEAEHEDRILLLQHYGNQHLVLVSQLRNPQEFVADF